MNHLTDILKTGVKLVMGRGSIRSFSQFGEDAVISALLRRVRGGFYVDVGAFHPIQYSNTYLLYERGWKGIAIDPSERSERLFKIFRPRDHFHRVGVGESIGKHTYVEFDDPAYNTIDALQAEEWKRSGRVVTRETMVPITTLAALLETEGVTSIDALSIDAEGQDLAVLRSHNWNILPRLILIEDHGFDADRVSESEAYRFLRSKGYVLRGICGPSLIFMRP